MVEIVKVKISTLSLLESNPRKISKDQMDKLCKSIKRDPEFLSSRPILVHKKENVLHVYAGNQRVRAAKLLKWKEIPCIIEENIPEDILKERIIKDNKQFGEFDFDMLANEYDIEMLLDSGFMPEELYVAPIEDLGSTKEKEEEKKPSTMCPQCGHEF